MKFFICINIQGCYIICYIHTIDLFCIWDKDSKYFINITTHSKIYERAYVLYFFCDYSKTCVTCYFYTTCMFKIYKYILILYGKFYVIFEIIAMFKESVTALLHQLINKCWLWQVFSAIYVWEICNNNQDND